MNIRVLPEAETEIDAESEWYEDRSEGLGTDFAIQVEHAFREILSRPRLYPRLEGTRTDQEFRSDTLDRFPHVVHYLIAPEAIVVFAVAHPSRHPDYWRIRKG